MGCSQGKISKSNETSIRRKDIHDIRACLNGVSGGIQLLNMSNLNISQKEIVNIIEMSYKETMELVNNL